MKIIKIEKKQTLIWIFIKKICKNITVVFFSPLGPLNSDFLFCVIFIENCDGIEKVIDE